MQTLPATPTKTKTIKSCPQELFCVHISRFKPA
jgi:hypothetical protein